MEKTIEQRAEEVARTEYGCDECHFLQCVRHGGKESPWDVIECAIEIFESSYAQGATEQKAIDDEAYRKDMRYVGVKQEELIDKVVECLKDICNDIVDEETGVLPFPDNYWLDHFKPQILAQIHKQLKQ